MTLEISSSGSCGLLRQVKLNPPKQDDLMLLAVDDELQACGLRTSPSQFKIATPTIFSNKVHA